MFMRGVLFVFCLELSGALSIVHATVLPYATRTRPFSGWSSTVRGDIRTIGMAGAMVGLADTFIASTDNPAGLSMTLRNVTIQLAGNKLKDGNLQDFDQSIRSSNIGIAGGAYPWGFSVGWWTPTSEGQIYNLPTTNARVDASVKVREFRFSAARVFFNNRLSLGSSFILGQAVHGLDFPDQAFPDEALHSYGITASFGLMWRTWNRILIGVAYNLPVLFPSDVVAHPSNGIADFNQPIKVPWHLALGTGWIPNRLFRLGTALYFVGKTQGAALLSDNNRLAGESPTVQPRIGANYVWAEFKDLKSDISMGMYLEPSRTAGNAMRFHFTTGLAIDIWILNLGWGIDRAPKYVNYIYTASIDVVRIFRKLDLIAEGWRPPQAGLFYPPFRDSEEGLPRGLVGHWVSRPGTDIFEMSAEFPKRLEEKMKEIGSALDSISGEPVIPDLAQPLRSSTPPPPAASVAPMRVKPKLKSPAKRRKKTKPTSSSPAAGSVHQAGDASKTKP